MGLYESLIRPLGFCFDPEAVHEVVLSLIARGVFAAPSVHDARLEQTLFGVRFSNPIGLAAGFDKNGVAAEHWEDLGFGFAELGTVTHLPQPGNPKPRLFRLPEDQALVNRLGFNNAGARALAERLREARPRIPLGINLGKSRAVELNRAPEDYAASYAALAPLGDYFVVNVSSPNTPGLRRLQDRAALTAIVGAVRAVDATRPLFVKVSPDLEPDAVDELADLAGELNLTGLIATNTTLRRDGLRRDPREDGGLSGAPLRALADQTLRRLSGRVPKDMILIGVGGLFTAEDVWHRIQSGAHLVQLYTGWVYGGPGTVPRLLAGLVERMDREGVRSLAELRGSAL